LFKNHNFVYQLQQAGNPGTSELTFSIYLSNNGNYIDFGEPRMENIAPENDGATFKMSDYFYSSGLPTKTSKWISEQNIDVLGFFSLDGRFAYPLFN